MRVHQLLVGQMQNFTYVLEDEPTRACAIVDPSWDLARAGALIAERSLRPELIINTHHHFDHTTGNAEMARMTGARIAQHPASGLEHDVDLNGGDTLTLGGTSMRVLHTPGHSKDSICLEADGILVTGDTLFVGSCGRVDLPGGDARELHASLFGVIARLDASLRVYPGHDYGAAPSSTLGEELRTNPVLVPRSEDDFVAMMGG